VGFGSPFLRWAVVAGGVVGWCVGAGLVVGAVRRGTAPAVYDVAWLAVLVAVSVWVPLRGCVRVDLDGGELRWRTLLRSGRVPLADVVGLDRFRLGRGAQLLRLRSGPTLVVLTRCGFRSFAAELAARAPDAEVTVPGTWWRSR